MIQYRRTMLVSTVRAIVKSVTGITLVTNYGDPDFAREFGLARKAFRFCEDLVMTRKNAFAIICVDEVISKYVSANFPRQRLHFLPIGACEEGFEPPTTESTIVKSLGRSLVWKGNVFFFTPAKSHLSIGYTFLFPPRRA